MNNKNTLQTICIFALFAFLFFLIIFMMYPFSTVILWTALLYVLLRPLYILTVNKVTKNGKNVKIKRNLFAAIFAIGTLILIITPILIMGTTLIQQGISFLQATETYIKQNFNDIIESEFIQKVIQKAQSLGISLPITEKSELKNSVLGLIHGYSSKLFVIGTNFVSSAGSFIVSLVFIVFALYFCFIDGPYLGNLIKKAIPIEPTHMKVLTTKFSDITKNLFAGYILVALYQGLAAFIIMLCFKVPGALFLSVILMFTTFIPISGAATVWLPVGIVICATRSFIQGIIFLILSAFCISFMDNFLRPLFLKDRINVHPLVIFFAILGGISFFGINGLILGPLIVILFFTVLDLLVSKKEPDFSTSLDSDSKNIDETSAQEKEEIKQNHSEEK